MTHIERAFHFAWFLVLHWIGQTMTNWSLQIERMALASYISGYTHKRFALRRMDSSIHILIYRTQDNIAHVVSVFIDDGDMEGMKNKVALKERATILFCEDFASFRRNAIRSAGTKRAVSL